MQLTHQIQLECKQKKLTNEPRSINPFTSGKIEKLNFWDANNFINFKHQ